MQPRLLALLILILLIGLPVLGYWYFFIQNVSAFVVSASENQVFSVHLEGTLKSKTLPLADQFLVFDKTCTGTCEFHPIAPIQYSLTLSSSGKIDIHDTVDISPGATVQREYQFSQDIAFDLIDTAPVSVDRELLSQANTQGDGYTYTSLDVANSGGILVLRNSLTTKELGELSSSGFHTLLELPMSAGDISLGITGQYFFVPLPQTTTMILSRDLQWEKEVKIPNIIGYVPGSEEKFLTQSGIIMSYRGSYGENPRFTDWIDLSDTLRLGYIAATDPDKLALSNYPLGTSVLILVDRKNNTSQIVRRGIDIRFFFFREGKPVYIDGAAKVYNIVFD